MMSKWIIFLFLICCLVGCGNETTIYAPVTDIATIEHIPKSGIYRVGPHETLYSIAWRYGLDYRYIANLNHLAPPFYVYAGERLYLTKNKFKINSTKYNEKNERLFSEQSVSREFLMSLERETNVSVTKWYWPARGRIIKNYSTYNKGINIRDQIGSPIFATAKGQVVYSGNGLRGYGNLIIIKHNNAYLSAYANNQVVLVKEGQFVQAGQKIAEMGSLLHFEIRRNGKPVNPLQYLN